MKRKHLVMSVFFIVFLAGMFPVQCSDAQIINDNTDSNQSQNASSVPVSGALNIQSILVNYQIRGGLILNATLDKDIKSIILEIQGYNTTVSPDAFGPHYLELWIPHKLLDTEPSDNFTVTINGQVVPIAQFPQKIEPRAIVIQYPQGINIVSIMGTRTVYDLANSTAESHETNVLSNPNNVKSTNNDIFSVQVISAIVFGIVVIVGAIFLIRNFVKKKMNKSNDEFSQKTD